jgi:hypothetical protein
MLDFNDTSRVALSDADQRRDGLRADLLSRLELVLTSLFPAGKKRRGKFLIGDVLGSPGDSLEVVLDGDKAGLWTDRATGQGGDIFDLLAAHFGLSVRTQFAQLLVEKVPKPTRVTVPPFLSSALMASTAASRARPAAAFEISEAVAIWSMSSDLFMECPLLVVWMKKQET